MNEFDALPERVTDQCGSRDEPAVGATAALASKIEAVLVRRILQNRLDGYTSEASREIATLFGFTGDGNVSHLTALGSFTRTTYEKTGRNADPVDLFEAGIFWAMKHLPSADRERAVRAEEDLNVIHRAAAYCQGKFGGRMSEVDRIFQEITRVSAMHKTRAALQQEGKVPEALGQESGE